MNREFLLDGGLTLAYIALIAWLLATAPLPLASVLSLMILPLALYFGSETLRDWKRSRDNLRSADRRELEARFRLLRASEEKIDD